MKPINNSNKEDKSKIVSASIKKLFPLISAKSPKKVKEISKYFKNLKAALVNKSPPKSYAQASKPANLTEKVIKIKDIFLSLKASKINQIQKIIKSRAKPKPHIQMTTKGPSRKHYIVKLLNILSDILFD